MYQIALHFNTTSLLSRGTLHTFHIYNLLMFLLTVIILLIFNFCCDFSCLWLVKLMFKAFMSLCTSITYYKFSVFLLFTLCKLSLFSKSFPLEILTFSIGLVLSLILKGPLYCEKRLVRAFFPWNKGGYLRWNWHLPFRSLLLLWLCTFSVSSTASIIKFGLLHRFQLLNQSLSTCTWNISVTFL